MYHIQDVFFFPDTRRSISRTSEKCITSGELLKQGYKSRETSLLFLVIEVSVSVLSQNHKYSVFLGRTGLRFARKKGTSSNSHFSAALHGSEKILRRAFLCLASTQLNRPGNVLDEGCFEGKFKSKSSIQGVCICRRYVLLLNEITQTYQKECITRFSYPFN